MLTPEALRREKQEKRRAILAYRRRIPENVRQDAARKMREVLLSSMAWREAGQILLYAEKDDEIPVTPLFFAAQAQGKTCFFPRCVSASEMRFYLVERLEELREGAFHVREPQPSREYQASYSDVCIVPALAFDTSGRRIGYGKGYYDRFLAGFCGITVGFCYSEMVEKRLPVNPYDAVVNILITERGLVRLPGCK